MEIKCPTPTELNTMSDAEKDVLILTLFDLLERLKELEKRVEKTSRNSGKPPSSDGLKKQAAEPRKTGEKSSGGQPGHKGITRVMVDTPDVVEELYPRGTCVCGAELDGQPAAVGERRQQFEIPPPRYRVTEYRQMRVHCVCGREHRGAFPPAVTPNVSYGPRLKAYAVGLVQGHFIALSRSVAIIGDQYGIQPSEGAVQKWIVAAGARLTPAYEAQREAILNADVAHFDESGMRVAGRLNWLHVAAAEQTVYYTVPAKRGREAMDAAGLLPRFKGIAVHDCWKPYWHYTDLSHALCNAHLLRELNYCADVTEQHWPVTLRQVLVDGKKAVAATKADGKTTLDTEQLEALSARYDAGVAQGLAAFPQRPPDPGQKGRSKQHEATNLLLRLREYKTLVLRFLTDWRVPFDNNLAERLVRPVKVKLKVAGGFRALGGSEAFCVIRSVWETDKLRSNNPFETLRLAFEGE